MQMISKKLFIILSIVLVIAIAVAAVLIFKFMQIKNPESPSEYAAVYLQTGEIYFGKINWFPPISLKNVWYLQRGVNAQNEVQLGILPFKNSFWGPIDKIYLNPKNIVWFTYLKNNSELVNALKNPDLLKQLNQPNQPQPNQPNEALPQNQPQTQINLQNNLEKSAVPITKQ
jgi:hypothetical protein